MTATARLRVVVLVRTLGQAGGGGAERLARELLLGLDPARFERMLCVSRAPAPDDATTARIVADVRARGVRVIILRRRWKFDLLAWGPLIRVLARERVDVLHAHGFGPNVWATVLGRLARVRVVIAHEHTWSFEGRPLRRLLDRRLVAPGSDAFAVVSRTDLRRMVDVERIDPRHLVLVPNGIRPLPAGHGDAVRAELGIRADAPVIGTVCVLRPQKALDVLVAAAALLVDEFPGLQVLIAGRGGEREPLEALAARLGLEGTVRFLGHRTDVPDVLAALDVAVSSSAFEGSPLAVLEFMDAARPIVATAVGGVPDLIEDGVHGLLVPPRDDRALARAIARLLRDPSHAAELGARARARRRAEFDLDGSVDRLARLYEELHVAGRGAGRG